MSLVRYGARGGKGNQVRILDDPVTVLGRPVSDVIGSVSEKTCGAMNLSQETCQLETPYANLQGRSVCWNSLVWPLHGIREEVFCFVRHGSPEMSRSYKFF